MPLVMTFSKFLNFKLKQKSHSLGVTQEYSGESSASSTLDNHQDARSLDGKACERRIDLLYWHKVSTVPTFHLVILKTSSGTEGMFDEDVNPEFKELAASQMWLCYTVLGT